MKYLLFLHKKIDLWLLLAATIGAALRLVRIGDFDNQYYTATVASMIKTSENFIFGSFDPLGIVMVDKPPVSFWIQGISATIFGVSKWSVNLPQAIAGTSSIIILYLTIKPTFGSFAARSSALILSIIPVSIVIDSRNEPDSLLSFFLVLAAFFIMRAVRTGKWKWLVGFSLILGIAFNVKMLVAFIPLPAFLLYYLIASRFQLLTITTRTTAAVSIIVLISLSWISVVAVTPVDKRPYVGSTQDNSVWTLAFKYNGLDRFTSFIGRRPQQYIISSPQGLQARSQVNQPRPQISQPGVNLRQFQGIQPGVPATQPSYVPNIPPNQTAGNNGFPAEPLNTGLFSLLVSPLAEQLGFLLPPVIVILGILLVPILTKSVYTNPRTIFEIIRNSPSASQTLLWGGWLATAILVFGLASSTTTHPYYLVGVAVPLSAVLGIGLSFCFKLLTGGHPKAWIVPTVLGFGTIYQAYGARTLVDNWIIALVLTVLFLIVFILSVSVYRQQANAHLTKMAILIGMLCVLIIPFSLGYKAGDRLSGTGMRPPPTMAGYPVNRALDQIEIISSFIKDSEDFGSKFAIGTLNSRDAAPFIIKGVTAVAIGGFSGSDPIFSLESFNQMVAQGDLTYFLMAYDRPTARPSRIMGQELILNSIRTDWEDLSLDANLPSGTLYKYVE
jgi:4-amino-4-deoxy-L-arabinose transferase-like glycosyltransferase